MKKGKSSNRYRTVTIDHKKTYSRSKIEVKKIGFLTLFLLCLTIGTSYAFLTQVITGTKVLSIVSGTFKIDFNDGNEINIENAQPITNEEGLNTDGYTFTITNNGSIDAKYKVTLEEKENNTLNKEYIRYSYKKKNGTYTTPKLLSEGLEIISNEELNSGASEEYTLKLWMDYDTPNEGQNKTFKARIVVDSTQKENEQEEETKIELLGDKNTTILKNSTYVDPGYVENENLEKTYEYYDGTTLSEVNEIDTTKVGIYYIHYKKEIDNKVIHEVRVVNVVEEKNEELPSITLIGNEEVTITKGDTYQDEGYTSSDEVITIGEVNTEVVGSYTIRYIAKKNNKLASVVRVVNVVEEVKHQVIYDYKTNGGTNSNESLMVISGSKADLTKTGEKEGYTFVGWNTNKDAHEGLTEVIVNETTILYAIYSKEGKTYTVTFDKNATAGATQTESCTTQTVYNNEEGATCKIIAPNITPSSEFSAVGYNKSNTATSSTLNVGDELEISKDETYYAVQKKEIAVTFDKNATAGTTQIENCTMYNNDSSCSVTSPSITPTSGYSIVGWGSANDSTTSSLAVNTQVDVSNNKTYYAIQRKVVSVTFTGVSNPGISAIGSTGLSCTKYNSDPTCSIILPDITANEGYLVIGWSRAATDPVTEIAGNGRMPGDSYSVESNTTLYAQAYDTPTISITSSQISNNTVQAASNQKASVTWNIKATSTENETFTFKVIDYYNQTDKRTSSSGIANGSAYSFTNSYDIGRHLLMVQAIGSSGYKTVDSYFFIVREYGNTSGGLSGIAMNNSQTLTVEDPGVYDSNNNPLSYISGFEITVPKISGHSSGNKDTFDLYGWNGTSWVKLLSFNTNDGTCNVKLNDKATSGTWSSSSSSGTFSYPQNTYYKIKFVYWNAHASCVASATGGASYSVSYDFISNSSAGTGSGSGSDPGDISTDNLFNF